MKKLRPYILRFQGYADRFWYPPLVGVLSLLDNFVLIIPNDGILISSSMMIPKRWLALALSVALGSTFGALILAALVEYQGLPWILNLYPGIGETKVWAWSFKVFDAYGLFIVFVIALTPLMQQPAVILASLANTPLPKLAAAIFAGRFLKYLFLAYLGSHAPEFLGKLWGLKGELRDTGVLK
ncbi:MAG TPA: hypothetical protein PLH57_05995 [Oligoflexia bacterium]|nr:hypothetical protein [Oligoflexia bacterium]